jgi:hypothetical protein
MGYIKLGHVLRHQGAIVGPLVYIKKGKQAVKAHGVVRRGSHIF